MDRGEGNVWSVNISLPVGKVVSYKYVIAQMHHGKLLGMYVVDCSSMSDSWTSQHAKSENAAFVIMCAN